ncbi:MAG: hypothetical protein WA906_05425 [Pacificimonas sp.]
MHLIVHAAVDNDEGIETALATLRDRQISNLTIWRGAYTSGEMWQRRQELQVQLADRYDWIVSADVDELHEYPLEIYSLANWCEARDIRCVQGPFVDRVASDGQLRPVMSNLPLGQQFPLQLDVACTVRQKAGSDDIAGTIKMMMFRSDLLPGLGGHSPPERIAPAQFLLGRAFHGFRLCANSQFRFASPVLVHHYKWHAALLASARRRLSTVGVSKGGKRYTLQLLDYLDGEERLNLTALPRRNRFIQERVGWHLRVRAFRAFAKAQQMPQFAKRQFWKLYE